MAHPICVSELFCIGSGNSERGENDRKQEHHGLLGYKPYVHFPHFLDYFAQAIWCYKPYVHFPCFLEYFAQTIWSYKPYVHFPCFLKYFAQARWGYKPYVHFPCFLKYFAQAIWGYKPYVHFQCDFRSISHTNLRLQTLCLCFVRFMQVFVCKLMCIDLSFSWKYMISMIH